MEAFMIFRAILVLAFVSSALFSMNPTDMPHIRTLLVAQARDNSVNSFNTLSPADRDLWQRACRKHNGRYDSDIGNLLESTKHNQKFQKDLIATYVTTDPYAQGKFKALKSQKALQIADDAKQLTTKSDIPLAQSFLLGQKHRNLCHKIVDESIVVDTPKERTIVHIDIDTYNQIAQLSPDIRQALGKRTLVVNRTFTEKLQHVGVSTVAYGLGGACVGAACGALEGAPSQYKAVFIEQTPDVAHVLIQKGVEGASNALKNKVLSPVGDAAIKEYVIGTIDGPFGTLSNESPEAILQLKPLVIAAVVSAAEAVPAQAQKMVCEAPPLTINKDAVVQRAKQGAVVGGLVGFVRGLATMNKPIKEIKIKKIGTKQKDQ
jgi:hypothetical protein